MNPSFTSQLHRHISFLERSCAAFDTGHHEEALRIAVSLRVLFHDTKKSVSLLTHLGIKDRVSILSTFAPGYTENKESGMISVSMPVWVSTSGDRVAPLGDTDRSEFIAVKEWWTEVIMCMNSKMNRRDVALAAANQDGGAHVEASPDSKTNELVAGIGTFSCISKGMLSERILDNQHFPLLRQIAYEVLNSPDLRNL